MNRPATLFFTSSFWLVCLATLVAARAARSDDRLIGRWRLDEGWQIVEFLFRSDGQYQRDTRSTDPAFDFASTDRGRYEMAGSQLSLTSYEYFGEPSSKRYEVGINGDALVLTFPEFSLTEVYRFEPGSRAEVLAKENVVPDPIGRWRRRVAFSSVEEYTFRPGGYYFVVRSDEGSPLPPETIRGRYTIEGRQLRFRPYSGVEAEVEMDFYGNTLTLISRESLWGEAKSYELVEGSRTEVRAKAADADRFLAGEGWQVGVWEVRDPFLTVDLTFRPDGHYIAAHSTELLPGIVRGRYTLEPMRVRLLPFGGQSIYARSNGEFGKVEQTRDLDYYDGELQFINLGALSQSVTIARKRPGSEGPVRESVTEAQAERSREDWMVGIWEVDDPLGWMQFTFRPDRRYIAMAGANGVPREVERGRYVVASDRVTLAPLAGLGVARGFELDLYDGNLFLVGDPTRMVIARKIRSSEAEVIEKTRDPAAMKGERGIILGLWTAQLPGRSSGLVFRDDGQFRLNLCTGTAASQDYGLYQVDMVARTLVVDSRFTPVQTLGLDFYGDHLTMFGGMGAPRTYAVHLGEADAAIEASFSADREKAQVDAQWLARVPVGPRRPDAVQLPAGDIPADPRPGRIFTDPTVFTSYRLYRRLIPGFVYFNSDSGIKSVAVVNTREWHFFPTGRVLVRFKNYYAGPFYPNTLVDVGDSWGAYRIGPKPTQQDILRLYADNEVFLDMDAGEQVEMTLEDGRRHLFWGKDYQILSEWATEQATVPCPASDGSDAALMNTGVSLSTSIPPDDLGDTQPVLVGLTRSVSGELSLHGTSVSVATVVVDGTTSLVPPVQWQSIVTNQVPAGPFTIPIPGLSNASAFFRIRRP